MKNKILFLKSRVGWKDPTPPIAFSYLGKIAKEKGFKVFVENLNAQYNTKNEEDIIEFLKKEKPLIIGISIFTNQAKNSYRLIKKIKPYSKTIVVGGPHATIFPKEALLNGADIVIIGEAEESFGKLLDCLSAKKNLKGVKGIAYKEKNKFVKTKNPAPFDLDKLPIPDREVHRKSDYIKVPSEINNFGAVLSSRGCPGRCTYCYHSLFGKCFRYRSAKKVFEEMVYLYEKYGITHINFLDDAFTVNKKRLYELCDMLIKAKLPIEWVATTRIDFLDKETIFKMAEAGCVMLSIGIESCIPHTLIKMKKTNNPEWYVRHADNVLEWCKQAEIRAGVNILTGFPWDTKEDIKDLQKYIKRINPLVTQGYLGGILQPMPDTEIYEEYAKKYGFEKWWINRKLTIFGDYQPYFMLHYHVFWDQLQNNFFDFDKKVFKEIDKLYKLMGKWNLWIITKRRFSNPMKRYVIYLGLLSLSKFSIFLYNIFPKLERKLMEPVAKFSYRFKFRK